MNPVSNFHVYPSNRPLVKPRLKERYTPQHKYYIPAMREEGEEEMGEGKSHNTSLLIPVSTLPPSTTTTYVVPPPNSESTLNDLLSIVSTIHEVGTRGEGSMEGRKIVVLMPWKIVEGWTEDRRLEHVGRGYAGLAFEGEGSGGGGGLEGEEGMDYDTLDRSNVYIGSDRVKEFVKEVISSSPELGKCLLPSCKGCKVWFDGHVKANEDGEERDQGVIMYGVFRNDPNVGWGRGGNKGALGFERGYVDVRDVVGGKKGERKWYRVRRGNRQVNGDWVKVRVSDVEGGTIGDDGVQGREKTEEDKGGGYGGRNVGGIVTADTKEEKDSLYDDGKIADVLQVTRSRNFTHKGVVGHLLVVKDGEGDEFTEDDKTMLSIVSKMNSEVSSAVGCVKLADDKLGYVLINLPLDHSDITGKRLIVTVEKWGRYTRVPVGRVKSVIGNIGEVETETQALLGTHGIRCDEFSKEVLLELPTEGAGYKIEKKEGDKRLDYREHVVCSVDPPGCQDIDDALSCRVIDEKEGIWEVGVHIADVGHYVKTGSKTDEEAARRSTSTYLVNRRLDMLPKLLTTDLCSLKGEVDRYAFSVLARVRENGEVEGMEFRKSIIKSRAALTYQQAQNMIDDASDSSPVACALRRIMSMSRILKQKRVDAGALTLGSVEVKFKLDDSHVNPTDVGKYETFNTNSMVEEMMLFANVAVAKRVLRSYPTLTVLRRHPSPEKEAFEELIEKASTRGFVIDPTTNKTLAESLDRSVDDEDPMVNKILRILSTRAMRPAQYFCSGTMGTREWRHFGLAAPVYSHFTSPIRRYPDLLLHRALAASIEYSGLPGTLASTEAVSQFCENSNRRHRAAQMAGRGSVGLFSLKYFEGNPKTGLEAHVTDVREAGDGGITVKVMVDEYGIEHGVKVKGTMSGKYEAVVEGEGSLKVFDKCRVDVKVVNKEGIRRLKIDFTEGSGGQQQKRKGDKSVGKASASKKKK